MADMRICSKIDMSAVWRGLAGVSGAMGVAMAAVSAHAVTDHAAAASLEKAALYQLLHAAVLLFLSADPSRGAMPARLCFLSGMVLFSGGIYLRHLADIALPAGAVPVGGLCYIAGWLVIAVAAIMPRCHRP